MSPEIHYDKKVFDVDSFIQLEASEPFVANAILFFKTWLEDGTFTFSTSGTTGTPRAFTFRKEQLQASAKLSIDAMQLNDSEQHILHCIDAGFIGGAMLLARAMVLGCRITIVKPAMDVLKHLEHVHHYTFISLVPSQLSGSNFHRGSYQQFDKILIGGAAILPALEQELVKLKPVVFHSYGMTETLSHIALRNIKSDTGFKTLKGIKIRLDEHDCLFIKAPYIDSEVITNDIAVLYDESHFTIKGRRDFVINSGGIKINPEQIELIIGTLMSNGIIAQRNFLISSVKDKILGEKCVCVFDSDPGDEYFKSLSGELRRELSDRYMNPGYFIPKEYYVVKAWPLTASGKNDRKKVNEQIQAQGV